MSAFFQQHPRLCSQKNEGEDRWVGLAGEEEKERVENIDEFVSGVIEYEKRTSDEGEEPTLMGFLEENALVADVDKYDERNWGGNAYEYALTLCLDAVIKL